MFETVQERDESSQVEQHIFDCHSHFFHAEINSTHLHLYYRETAFQFRSKLITECLVLLLVIPLDFHS